MFCKAKGENGAQIITSIPLYLFYFTAKLETDFLAYVSVDTDVSGYSTAVFDTEAYDNGGQYNNNNGVFTAKYTGMHLVYFRCAVGGNPFFLIMHNDISIANVHNGDFSAAIKMNPGDTMKVVPEQDITLYEVYLAGRCFFGITFLYSIQISMMNSQFNGAKNRFLVSGIIPISGLQEMQLSY